MIGSGKNRYQLLDVEDLCDAIYACAVLDENKVNDTFNIGAKEFTTMKEDYQAVLDYAGFGKKRTSGETDNFNAENLRSNESFTSL